MKKILLFVILCLCFIGKVNAQDITLDKFVNVVNVGDVTKAFVKSFPEGSTVGINGVKVSDSEMYIEYNIVVPKKEKGEVVGYINDSATISFVYDSSTKILKGEKTFDQKEDAIINPYITHVLKLVPYWTVEASNKYENIKGYMGSEDIIKTFEKIFDRCYFDKMGVCFTEITEYTLITYMSKVELTDKGADYAIAYFKEVERQNDESEFLGLLTKILIGLVIAIVGVYLLRGVILSITKQ